MNWKGYGRKRSWLNVRYNSGVCFEGPASHRGGQGSHLGQFMWNFCTKCWWDRFYSEFVGFTLFTSFHRGSLYSYIIWGWTVGPLEAQLHTDTVSHDRNSNNPWPASEDNRHCAKGTYIHIIDPSQGLLVELCWVTLLKQFDVTKGLCRAFVKRVAGCAFYKTTENKLSEESHYHCLLRLKIRERIWKYTDGPKVGPHTDFN
jgi:hypothetical protein